MRRRILLTALLFGALWISPPLWAFSGLEKSMLDEPVFNGQVAVYQGGKESGKTVVLVHGIGGDSRSAWANLIPALLEDYRLLALDLPGFGESSSGNHQYSPDNYARVLHHVITELVDEPVILVGHSLGGAVSLRYAAAHPDQVRRLHLISVPGILHRASYTEFLASRGADEGDGAEYLPSALGKAIRKFVRRTPDGRRVLESATLRRLLLGGDSQRIAALALVATDFSETLDQVTAPTSVYWGVNDITAPLRTGKLLSARLPYADLVLFDEAGHVPMSEQTPEFESALLPRLERPLAGGTRIRPTVGPGKTDKECNGETGWRLTGSYRHVSIQDCKDAVLDQVSAEYIEIKDSRVTLISPAIRAGDGDPAIKVRNSRLSVIGGQLSGQPVIDTGRTSLDLIGPRLIGTTPFIVNPISSASEVIFSVTAYDEDGDRGYWHKMINLEKGDSM